MGSAALLRRQPAGQIVWENSEFPVINSERKMCFTTKKNSSLAVQTPGWVEFYFWPTLSLSIEWRYCLNQFVDSCLSTCKTCQRIGPVFYSSSHAEYKQIWRMITAALLAIVLSSHNATPPHLHPYPGSFKSEYRSPHLVGRINSPLLSRSGKYLTVHYRLSYWTVLWIAERGNRNWISWFQSKISIFFTSSNKLNISHHCWPFIRNWAERIDSAGRG